LLSDVYEGQEKIKGIHLPFLYHGSKSSYLEDYELASVSFLHRGHPKYLQVLTKFLNNIIECGIALKKKIRIE